VERCAVGLSWQRTSLFDCSATRGSGAARQDERKSVLRRVPEGWEGILSQGPHTAPTLVWSLAGSKHSKCPYFIHAFGEAVTGRVRVLSTIQPHPSESGA
jgi:hypothetical protein